jgi:hypothetical protein
VGPHTTVVELKGLLFGRRTFIITRDFEEVPLEGLAEDPPGVGLCQVDDHVGTLSFGAVVEETFECLACGPSRDFRPDVLSGGAAVTSRKEDPQIAIASQHPRQSRLDGLGCHSEVEADLEVVTGVTVAKT